MTNLINNSRLVVFIIVVISFVPMVLGLSESSSQLKVAVIGTTGRLGRNVVMQLSSKNIPTRCLLRHELSSITSTGSLDKDATSAEVAAYLSKLPNVEMVKGDVTDTYSLKKLMEGCTVIMALHGPAPQKPIWKAFFLSEDDPMHSKMVCYQGVKNILQAAPSDTLKRIVRITGNGEAPFSIPSMLINLFGTIAKGWNYEGEQLLRTQNQFDYTIIRPGIMSLDYEPSSNVYGLRDNGQQMKISKVSHSQMAQLCVDLLDFPNTARSTLTAMNVEENQGESSYRPLLTNVKPDSRSFPKSLIHEHKKGARIGAVVLTSIATMCYYFEKDNC